MKLILKTIWMICLTSSLFILGCGSHVKPYPEYRLSDGEIARAKEVFRKDGGSILFQIFLDRKGSVLKAEVLDWDRKNMNLHTANRFGRKMKIAMVFSTALPDEPAIRVITRTIKAEEIQSPTKGSTVERKAPYSF